MALSKKTKATPLLGDKVRDIVTGFEGIAVARYEYMNGCVRFGVQASRLKEDGTPTDQQIFDVEQIEVVQGKAISLKVEPSGGDRSTPSRPSAPAR